MSESCDVLVIGGGPGGSTAATLLADDGLNVVLLERTTFPREHVGESLLPASIPVLEQLGVMPAVEAAGFVTKRGATLVWGKEPDPWSWYFADDPGQRPTSFQVVRSEFDKILLDNAKTHGVHVRENHHVLDVEMDGDRATGVQYRHDGETGQIDARFIVDASGQAALIGNKLALRQWDTYFQNLAVYGYYRDAKHLDPPNDGNIFIESYEHGWLWKIPLHTGVTSVGAVVDKDFGQEGVRSQGASDFLEAQIAQAPHMRALLAGGALVDDPQIERDWSYSSSRFAGDGYVLVGDAACFIDPLFSSGVHLALGGATLAATYVRSALANPAAQAQAAQAYQSIYEKQYQYFHLTAQLFYGTNRSADSYFWEARRILGEDEKTPREAFVKVVGGQAPQGYERAVIERGEVPSALTEEIHRMESWFKQRKESTEALLSDAGALLRTVPTLPGHVSLEQKPILGPNDYKQAFQLVVTRGETLTGGYPVSALIAACVGKMNGRRTVGDIIAVVAAENSVEAGSVQGLVQRDLPALIGGGLVDITVQPTGRNDPCPCGSGKKFKRCHGAATPA